MNIKLLITIKRISISIVLLLVTSSCIASEVAPRKEKSVVKLWAPTPFLNKSKRLPAGYVGVDTKKFFEMFKTKVESVKKGEFETSDEFAKRTADKNAILSPINTSDLYAFRFNIYTKYDADTQSYIIETGDGTFCSGTIPGEVACIIATARFEKDTYAASNAFGGTTEVDRIRGLYYALWMTSDSSISDSGLLDSNVEYKDSLSVPLAKARELKDQLISALFVGQITDDKLSDWLPITSTPTFDDPTDVSIQTEAIPFDLRKIIYYVVQTGEILKERDFDKGQQ